MRTTLGFFFLLGGVGGSFGRRHFRLALLRLDALVVEHVLLTLRLLSRDAVAVVGHAFLIDPLVGLACLRVCRRAKNEAEQHGRQEGGGFAHAGYFALAHPPGDTAPMPQVL